MANKDTQRTSAESYRDDRKARLAQSAKKSQKKSEKSKAAAKIVKMVVAIVLAVVVAGGIVWKVLDDTAAIKKNTTVFSLGDDIRVSEVEFTYYYSQYLNNIYSYAQQYAMYGMNIGIDPTKSPDEQNYGTDADGKEMLLSDYLKNETISALQTYKILYAEAIKQATSSQTTSRSQLTIRSRSSETPPQKTNTLSTPTSRRATARV